jgi:valyl-tRNA synthetase
MFSFKPDLVSETDMHFIMDIITAIRKSRSDSGMSPKDKINITAESSDDRELALIVTNQHHIRNLAGVGDLNILFKDVTGDYTVAAEEILKEIPNFKSKDERKNKKDFLPEKIST